MRAEPTNTILLVNDAPDVLGMMGEVLRQAGFRVLTAVEGGSAFEAAKRERPDLILSDVIMPGVSGIGLCRLVRGDAGLSATPFILYSAQRKDSESAVEGLRSGADDYLEVPVDPALIVAKVTRLLERRRGEAEIEAGRRQLQFIADTASVYIAHCDAEGRFKFVNRGYAERLGLRCDEVVGRKISEVLGDKAYQSIEGHVRAALGGRSVEFETEIPYQELGPRWMHCSYVPEVSQGGEIRSFVAVITDVTERRRAEEALRESKEHLVLAQRVAGMGSFDWDLRTGMAIFSAELESLYGAWPGDFDGCYETWLNYVHPEDLPLVRRNMKEALQTGVLDATFRITRPGGDVRWMRGTGRVLHGPDGAPERLVGVNIDVTERRRADDAARESEARLRLITSQMPALLWTTDRELRVTSSAGAPHRLAGSSPSQFMGMTVFEVNRTVEESHPNVSAHLRALGGESVRFETEWGDMTLESYIEPLYDGEGRIVGTLGLAVDVTERKRMVEELRRRSEFTAALTGSLAEGLVAVDLEGHVTFMNPKAEELLGWAAEELRGRRLHDAVHFQRADGSPYPAEECNLEKALMTYQSVHAEDEAFTRKDGTIFPVTLTAAPVVSAGRVIGVVKSFQDQTRRRQIEERLRQAQKMEAVGHLAGGVAHDFNNLLTAINGFSDLALRRAGDDEVLRLQLEEIKKAGERAAGLTRQLLAFSRKQMLQPKVLNLNDVITDTSRMLRRLIGEDVDLTLHLDSGLGLVKADPGQVEQVLMNLAVNARDAMPRGGNIIIETENVVLDEEAARRYDSVRPGPHVLLTVSDTGHGMDEETMSHVFEPFFTTKEVGKGTGLGLSTVYGIVKQSGGHASVESEVGRGTTFEIYLPSVDAPAESGKDESAGDEARGTEKILLVEDDEMVRHLTHQVLAEYGYKVLEARNGAEAISLCERGGGEIDLVLTDVVMPEMSGRELAARLSALRPRVRVLYMSGYTNDAIVHHGVLEEGTHFLEKPFTPAALARKVREVLGPTAGPPM